MKHLVCLIIFFCTACSSHYEIHQDRVEYITWNEGSGKVTTIVKDANPKTFEKINDIFGKDDRYVFWRSSQIVGADVKSFRVIDNFYGKDQEHGFVGTKIIEGAIGESFEYIGHGWSRDKNNYFYGVNKLDICDYESFQIIESILSDRAIDNECLYYKWKRVPIRDRATLQIFHANYAKDKFNVYSEDKIIEGADPLTFSVKNERYHSIAKDKNQCYLGTQVLSCDDLNAEGKAFCNCQ